MDKLMILEQNNEILHQHLIQNIRRLEISMPSLTEEYENFYKALEKLPIEERALLLLVVSEVIIKLSNQIDSHGQRWLRNLSKYESSVFGQILRHELENDHVEALAWL